jgi:PAT family beta-lactamase induction signal transducer AmpG
MDSSADVRPPHGAVFSVLYLPFGIVAGYFTVTLGFLLSRSGVDATAIALIASINLFPQTWGVVWAPILDSTLSYRRWYVIATTGAGLGVAAVGFIPTDASMLLLFDVVVLVASIAVTVTPYTTNALMAHTMPDGKRGRAAGWAQAGNIGGQGLGGGLGLWLAQHAHAPWIAGATLGALCIACSAMLIFVAEPLHVHRAPRFIETLKNIGKDVWDMARSRTGYMAMVLLLMPMGTGAAAILWGAVAHDWHASGDVVAAVAGVLGGLVSALGSIFAGRFADSFGPKPSYLASAFLMSVTAVGMAIAARTPMMFTVFALIYALTNGFMYGAYGSVVLEAIGRGCAATKAPLLGCLTNIPVLTMTMVDGNAQTYWGSGGMLITEAVVGFAGMAFFAVFVMLVR